jgi:putative endonuclease
MRTTPRAPPVPFIEELPRRRRGRRAQRSGVVAESRVAAALTAAGWAILGRRLRTPAGEIDIVAERDGLLAIVEVKASEALDVAAYALRPTQRLRLLAAAEILLGANPSWGPAGIRFDLWLVDHGGALRHVPDAFRQGD